MCELENMLKGLSPERQQAIRDKADRMEAYFNTAGVLFMKDKNEQWVEGMFDEGDSESDLVKLEKEYKQGLDKDKVDMYKMQKDKSYKLKEGWDGKRLIEGWEL